jgi:hypothetical protein
MSEHRLDGSRMALLGAVVGGAVGYFFRPSAFLVGQLPFMQVLSRGKSLKGIDQILVPVAEASFNYMLAGVVLGAVLGYALGRLLNPRQ